LVVVDVGAAHADGGDLHQHVPRPGRRPLALLDPDLARRVEDGGLHSPVTAPSVSPVTSHFRTTRPTTIIGATTIVPIAVSCPQSISVWVTSCDAAIGSVCESGPEN